MASGGEKMLKIKVTNKEGCSFEGYITPDVAKMLRSPDTDPEAKQAVYEAIANATNAKNVRETQDIETHEKERTGTQNETIRKEPQMNITVQENQLDKQEAQMIIHSWTEAEEKMLIAVFTDHEDLFNGIQNHETVWSEITRKLNSEGVPVTKNQVINKWKYMRKNTKKLWIIIIKPGVRQYIGNITKNSANSMETKLQRHHL